MSEKEIQRHAETIREFVGDLSHHPNCNSRRRMKCDCYAGRRSAANDSLAALLDELKRLREAKPL